MTALGFNPGDVEKLRMLNDKLNEEVMEQVNSTQELVMLNSFAHECNEYLFKKSAQQRISEIASWRWVLGDLAKRLEDASEALNYELNALNVVRDRIQNEISGHSQAASKPGALGQLTDSVEEAIHHELIFLRTELNKFEKMIPELEKKIYNLKKTKKRIEVDVLNKQQTMEIEDACVNINLNTRNKRNNLKKKRCSPLLRWENRCQSLKKAGLKAICNAMITRQQVRGARVHLSIAAQAYAARADSALRRRLHTNYVKLQDLKWQKEEAIKDNKALEEELELTERNLLETMELVGLNEARLADRSTRPPEELTKDDVDRKLRDEIGRLKNFTKYLRDNRDRISSLQNHLSDCIARIECCSEDLNQLIQLDDDRIKSRFGDGDEQNPGNGQHKPDIDRNKTKVDNSNLAAILEENEDDYPFDY